MIIINIFMIIINIFVITMIIIITITITIIIIISIIIIVVYNIFLITPRCLLNFSDTRRIYFSVFRSISIDIYKNILEASELTALICQLK